PIGNPGGELCETMIRHPFSMLRQLTEPSPFLLRLHGDNAPAIIPFAAIATVRRSGGAEIALRLGFTAIDEIFQISRTQHSGCGFGLGNIDVLTFTRSRSIVQRSENRDGAVGWCDVIRERRLARRPRPVDFWVAP